ncbi:oligosaccharide flippase family protein [Halobacillus litoralis]|uniref:oligosaccharide flippase family protein n=1 Tax=Halobacillus litoralis TaxID=45668 RepID=UPI001CFD7948|nr:oligosaccharide flippase family protein [Halobacillus litoralis]
MKAIKGNSIGKNILHLFCSTVLASVLNAVALIALASYLESYYYGLFSVVLAFSMIMGYFTDAGLSRIVVRESSIKKNSIPIVIMSYLKLRIAFLIGTLFLGFILIHTFYPKQLELIQTSYYLLIPMVTGLTLQSIGTAYFQVIEKMQYSGLIRITTSICLVIAVLIGMSLSISPIKISFLYGVSYLAGGVLALLLVRKNMDFKYKSKFHKGLFKELWPFTIAGLLFVLTPQLGPIVLEQTVSLREVGLFAVAYRIPQALQQIPFVVAGAYFPVMYRCFNNNKFKEHMNHNVMLVKIMALMGMSIAIPLFFLSDFIIRLLFGGSWAEAVEPLKILSLMLALQMINISLADGLTTQSMQVRRTRVEMIALLSGVIFYFTLSNSYGIIGAAFAGLMLEMVFFIGYLVCTPQRLTLLQQAVFPYLTYFIACFIFLNWLFSDLPSLSTFVGYLLLLIMVALDRPLNRKLLNYVKKLPSRKNLKSKGVEHG